MAQASILCSHTAVSWPSDASFLPLKAAGLTQRRRTDIVMAIESHVLTNYVIIAQCVKLIKISNRSFIDLASIWEAILAWSNEFQPQFLQIACNCTPSSI